MKKVILQQAFEELNNAIEYYEEQKPGLGLKHKNKVDIDFQIMFWTFAPIFTPKYSAKMLKSFS